MSEEESYPEHLEVAEKKERVTTVVLHESKLEKAFRAVCLNGATLSIGLSVAFLGAALPDLQDRTKSGIDEITKIFVARGLGFLVGVIFSHYLLRQVYQACWITFALGVLAIVMAMVPSCMNMAFLMGTLFIQGAACEIVKAGCGFIRQHHFFPADVTWGRMLYVSYGIGAFLAPALLLPFSNVNIGETSGRISLHQEDLPLHLSTVLTHPVPPRSDVIAPHVLARRRRDATNYNASVLFEMVENATIEVVENATKEVIMNQFTSSEFLNTSTTGDLININDSVEYGVTSEYQNSSVDVEMIQSINTTDELLYNNDSIQATPNASTTVSLSMNGSSANSQLNVSVVTTQTTSTQKMHIKPQFADGEILDQNKDVADSRKFRNELRQNIKNPVPDNDVPVIPSTSSTSQSSSVSTILINASSSVLQNFSSYSLGNYSSSTPIMNLSGLFDDQILPTDTEAVRTRELSSVSLHPAFVEQSLFHLPEPNVSSPTPILTSSHILSSNPTVSNSHSDIKMKDTLLPNVLTPITLQSSATTLLKSTSPPAKIPILSSAGISANALNSTIPSEKPVFAHLWLSKYSYWIAAFLIGLTAMAFAFYWVLCPKVYQARLPSDPDDPSRVMTCRFSSVFVATIFHTLYAGIEVSFAILVTSYAVVVLQWSWWLGVLLSLVYWGSFSVGRIFNFIVFSCLRQSVVLFGSLLVCVIVSGGVFLSFQPGVNFVLSSSGVAIWLLVGVLGFAMSAILPAGVAEIDKFLPRHSEFFQVFGAALGEMILPPVIGSVMTFSNPVWLAYILLTVFVLFIITCTVVRFLVIRSSEMRVSRASRPLPSSEQDDLEDVLISTNDETELLAKSMHSLSGSPLNGHNNGSLAAPPSAIQSLMKNISNVKRD